MRFSFFGVREYPGSSSGGKVILSDGEEAWLKGMKKDEVRDKMAEDTLEERYTGVLWRCWKIIERRLFNIFRTRFCGERNSGYAIDQLLYSDYFDVVYEESLICASY